MDSNKPLDNTTGGQAVAPVAVLEPPNTTAAVALAEALDSQAHSKGPGPDGGDDGDDKPLWYLAYGSNLNSNVFRGRRGIRPLDAKPVLAPGLQLVFDLPGVPYLEPRFANCRVLPSASTSVVASGPGNAAPLQEKQRQHCGSDSRPDRGAGADAQPEKKSVSLPGAVSSSDAETELNAAAVHLRHGPWTGTERAMLGVAYLVTPRDFASILASEGGGSSYKMVAVDARVLKASPQSDADAGVEQGDGSDDLFTGEVVRAFTLVAPSEKTRDVPGESSLRYLNLIRGGAKG